MSENQPADEVLKSLEEEARDAITRAADLTALEAAERRYTGKKGLLRALFQKIVTLSPEQRRSLAAP